MSNTRPPTMDCEHRWDEPSIYVGEGVIAFDCKVCHIHVACGFDNPSEYRTGGAVLCGDGVEYELCMRCQMPRGKDGAHPYLRDNEQCQCWKCSVCGATDDGDYNVNEDWCQSCEDKEEST